MTPPQTQTWTAAEMLAAQSECVSIAYDKRQEACAVRNDKLASMLRYAAASAEREAALRAENERLTAVNESVAVCRNHVDEITADECWVCRAYDAESALAAKDAEIRQCHLDYEA